MGNIELCNVTPLIHHHGSSKEMCRKTLTSLKEFGMSWHTTQGQSLVQILTKQFLNTIKTSHHGANPEGELNRVEIICRTGWRKVPENLC
jgi:hypothetical protein